jgi:glutamate-1-semialdehyde 2,1-aminomutase
MKNKGQKLWERAKRLIPGGNMLLSKRPELFLPNLWPVYFSRSKGCSIWDLNNKKYFDVSLMGVGANLLGYCNNQVDNSVKNTIKKGVSTTLNCPEEVFLAEKLVELHPWAQMVRFARTGGEANAIAVRIARAASGKEKVAFCGYHGWHDWYLSANIDDQSNLNKHLLAGLNAKGIPLELKNTSIPFLYNDIGEFEKIISNNQDIGCVIMEVFRNVPPENNFLQKIRDITKKKNIVLIFDECTSAFRKCFGGLHKIYGVEPDMAMFGKALGNGYAISAIIGRKEIMEAAQDTFISSTFWTERIGPVAALSTLNVMKEKKSWMIVDGIGSKIKNFWLSMSEKYKIKILTQGLPALINFSIPVDNWLKYKTFLTQEMLKNGFLASNAFFACTEHKEKIIEQYFYHFEKIFFEISNFENGKKSVDEYLETDVAQTGFQRLN